MSLAKEFKDIIAPSDGLNSARKAQTQYPRRVVHSTTVMFSHGAAVVVDKWWEYRRPTSE
jgi:hypothetical protein